jgi:hypothetical protein
MRGRRWIGWLGLLCLSSPALAQTLYGLRHDAAAQQLELVTVDSAGALTAVGAGFSGSAPLIAGASAIDPAGGRLYALERSVSGTQGLLAVTLSSGAISRVGTVDTGGDRALALQFDPSGTRLVLLTSAAADGALSLRALDPISATTTLLNATDSSARVLTPGASALRNGALLTVGRARNDPSDSRALLRFALDGSVSPSSALASHTTLAALATDPATSRSFGVRQSAAGAELVELLADGSINPIGAPTAGCCALAIDVASVHLGGFWALGRRPADAALALLRFDLSTGALTAASSAIPTGRSLLALHADASGGGLIATTTSISAIAPSPALVGGSYAVAVDVVAAVVGSTPTGTVLISDGAGRQCTITLPAMRCILAAPTAGSLTIGASYSGDALHAASATTGAQRVDPVTALSLLPQPVSRAQGSAWLRSPIALLVDQNGPVNTPVMVTINGGAMAQSAGVSVRNVRASNGMVSAEIRAGCFAQSAPFDLAAASASTVLTVLVTPGSNPNWCQWWPR